LAFYFKELLEAFSPMLGDAFVAELLVWAVLALPLNPSWCFLFFD
jgi:hypothetical protein